MREHHMRELLLVSLYKYVHIHGALAILVTMYGACLGAERHDISLCLFTIPVRSIFFRLLARWGSSGWCTVIEH